MPRPTDWLPSAMPGRSGLIGSFSWADDTTATKRSASAMVERMCKWYRLCAAGSHETAHHLRFLLRWRREGPGWKKNRLRRKKIACPARKIACIETKIGCVGGFYASDADEKSSVATNFSCVGSFSASGEAGAASLASVHACIAANLACETAPFCSVIKSIAMGGLFSRNAIVR